MIASPTGRGEPTSGFKCMIKPGLELTSITAPPCASSGERDVLGDQIDAGDVETDGACGEHALVRGLRVQAVGLVDRQIAVV